MLRQELDAQRYTNVYLFTKYVRDCDIEDVEFEIQEQRNILSNGGNHLYTHEQIRDMIYSYHWRKNILIDEGYIQDSNGTAQYGIDAAMPKPQGKTTDKVQAIATRMYYQEYMMNT